jgi:hypothetical protein
MKKLSFYILALILVALSSCTDDNNDGLNVFSGTDYFPLSTGHTLVYKITEINIDKPSDVYDTSIYYLKEIVELPFIDNEGDTAWRLERFTRNSETENWLINSVWSAKNTGATAEKSEENRRYVKIRFPAKAEKTWNGNIYNDLELKEYRIAAINYNYSIGSYDFDSCLMVVHDSSSSLIHIDRAYEVYGLHTGLIYKEETYLNSQEVIFDVPVEERVTTGTIYKMELVEIEGYE